MRRKREIVRGALDGKQIEVVKNLVERVNGQDGLNIRAPVSQYMKWIVVGVEMMRY